MDFDELWEKVCLSSDLPEGAKVHLPNRLSESTKGLILEQKLSADELKCIVQDTINTINAGSVEPIDDLVLKSLEKKRV